MSDLTRKQIENWRRWYRGDPWSIPIPAEFDRLCDMALRSLAPVQVGMVDRLMAERINELESELSAEQERATKAEKLWFEHSSQRENLQRLVTSQGIRLMELEEDIGWAVKEREIREHETRERMLSSQCGELATALRACEQQLVLVSHLWRGADHFEHAQLCSDIAYQARLVLQKWEEL